MFDLDDYVFGALRAGASGFLLKTAPPPELADAVRSCHSGEMLFAPTITRRLVEAYVHRPPTSGGIPDTLAELTQREIEVLRAIARGLSNAEIPRRGARARGSGSGSSTRSRSPRTTRRRTPPDSP